MAVTLAEKQAELAQAKAALSAARLSTGYTQGDRSLQRASIPELEAHVARLAREVRELETVAAGGRQSGSVGVTWC